MLVASLVLIGIAIGAALFASAIACIARLLTGSDALSLALGGLLVPALILASLAYWIVTMEVDDAPPGPVIMGNLTVLAVITPLMLLVSSLTMKFLSRRTPRNGG